MFLEFVNGNLAQALKLQILQWRLHEYNYIVENKFFIIIDYESAVGIKGHTCRWWSLKFAEIIWKETKHGGRICVLVKMDTIAFGQYEI